MAKSVGVTMYCYDSTPPAMLARAHLTVKSDDSASAWLPVNDVPDLRDAMKRRSFQSQSLRQRISEIVHP